MSIGNDDFRNEFMAQFHETAVERLGACKGQLDRAGDEAAGRVEMVRARAEILRELHAFKGEARMMGAEEVAGPVEVAERYIKDRSVPLTAVERRLLLRTFEAVEKMVGHMAGTIERSPTAELNALLRLLTRTAPDAKPDPDKTAKISPAVARELDSGEDTVPAGFERRKHVNIVLLDDSDIVRGMVVNALASAGYPARGVGTLVELQAACQHKRPNLILCDYHLDGMTGADAIRELSADVQTAGIPVIIFSGMEPHELAAAAEASKAAGFLPKPDDMAKWIRQLDAVADRYREFE